MANLEYEQFLATKQYKIHDCGKDIPCEAIHPKLFEWQNDITRWACKKGRAAIFLDTGLGKTFQQLEWARLMGENTLIIAPLTVARQTVREARKIDLDVRYVRSKDEITPNHNLWITNYEMIESFDFSKFGSVVLDESSILKSIGGKTRQLLTELCANIPYRLCCTATPAPNDYIELGNHTEFLGICKQSEMLAMFFINANKEHTIVIEDKVYRQKGTNKGGTEWRLKHHAEQPFFRWLSSWAITMTKPSDLGYEDDGFILPPLNITPIFVHSDYKPEGQMFFTHLHGISDRVKIRRSTVEGKLDKLQEIVKSDNGQWIIWCGLDSESGQATKLLNATEVKGNDSIEYKIQSLENFQDGKYQTLVTKAKIAGHGMNLQNASNMAFLGLNDCYDEETEILTKRGWLKFNQIRLTDDVATTNPTTLQFEWQKPNRIIWEHYQGEMLHFVGQRNYDLLVTPNHKLFVQRCPIRFINGDKTWNLKYASEIYNRYRRQEYRMLSSPKSYLADNPQAIAIPLTNGRINSRSRLVTNMKSVDFMMLVGWYLSEGYCRPLNSKEAGRITISQSHKHQANRDEITSLLRRIGLHVNSNTKDITSYSKNLASFLTLEFGSASANKHIPQWVKEHDSALLRVLRDTMIKGDGCHSAKSKYPRAYRTNSLQLANDFQEICIKTGIRASFKTRHYGNRFGTDTFYDVVLAWENLSPSISKKPEATNYNGMIGCVSVPNHVVIIRRNGIPIISGNSWESYYQAIRREWRYGQTKPVNVYLILSDVESEIYQNIMRKDAMAKRLISNLVTQMQEYEKGELNLTIDIKQEYKESKQSGGNWTALLGDSCQRLKEIPDNGIDLSIYSPPFADLFTYSSSERDLGNSRGWGEFFEHYKFIIREVLRVTKQGRLTCVHTSDIPAMAQRDGYIGLRDFPGEVIRAYEKEGWIFHGRCFIQKDPQAQAIRTHGKALLFVQLRKDSSDCRPALIDQILIFKKEGNSEVPVTPVANNEMDNETWIEWANGIWLGIQETETLQFSRARDKDDEKHIAPLQLGTIERCVKLYSNPNETVLSPFMGIGSEGYEAILWNRKFIGIELKESYYNTAVKNLKQAEILKASRKLC